MNSKHPDFHWQLMSQPGRVWLAVHPMDGEPLHQSIAMTPWSCRAELLKTVNLPWEMLKDRGWVVQAFDLAVPTTLNITSQVTSNESRWRYVADGDIPPRGVGLCLLTIGRIQVTGEWVDNAGYIAWAPKIQRDKQTEERLGL